MLYDLKYTSLEANHKLPASKHILADISPKDIETFKAEVAKALNAWRNDKYGQLSSRIDWRPITQAAMERNGDCLSELRELLVNVSSCTNVTATVSTTCFIAFALVMPYIDHFSVLSFSAKGDNRVKSLEVTTQQPYEEGLKSRCIERAEFLANWLWPPTSRYVNQKVLLLNIYRKNFGILTSRNRRRSNDTTKHNK